MKPQMNTENTDENYTFSRRFLQIKTDFSLPQLYCHPESIEGDSLGAMHFKVSTSIRQLPDATGQCGNLRVLRRKNIIHVYSHPSAVGFTIFSRKIIRGVINV